MASIDTAPTPDTLIWAAAADRRTTIWVSAVFVIGFGVGVLTASGQVWLGDSTSSVAN